MEGPRHSRPRVSRETRLLLATVCLAVGALWVLSRIRTLELASTRVSTAAQPLLASLGGTPSHDALRAEVARVAEQVSPWLTSVVVHDASGTERAIGAVRLRDDLVLSFLPTDAEVAARSSAVLIARDRPTGLSVVRVQIGDLVQALPVMSRVSELQPWTLLEVVGTTSGAVLLPFLTGSVSERRSRLWAEPVWELASRAQGLGSTVFTLAGEFAGVVLPEAGAAVLVPATTVLKAANDLLAAPPAAPGHLGIDVEPLAPLVARMLGVGAGVAVTWVDPTGPSSHALTAGDVVQSLGGMTVRDHEDWSIGARRIGAGRAVSLTVVRDGAPQAVEVVAAAFGRHGRLAERHPLTPDANPGVEVRYRPGRGLELIRVTPGSRAERAGLLAGDVIVRLDAREGAALRAIDWSTIPGNALVTLSRGEHRHVRVLGP